MFKSVIIYSMKTCPHCQTVKKMMEDKEINFIERDVREYDNEYQKVIVENTKNEYLPAFCLLEMKDGENKESSSEVTLMTPDDDFKSLEEAIEKIENFLG